MRRVYHIRYDMKTVKEKNFDLERYKNEDHSHAIIHCMISTPSAQDGKKVKNSSQVFD